MSALTWLRAGGALLVLTGALHFLGRFAPPPDSPAFALAHDAMQAFSLRIFGVETTLHAIHELLDWCFTLLSLLLGALNLAAAPALAPQPGALRSVAPVAGAGCLAVAVAGFVYRVLPFAIFYSLAAALFAAAALRSTRT